MDNIVKNESRRDFLKVSGTVAGGLALGFYLPQGPRVAQATASYSPNAWITIGTDNKVTVFVARAEMGQDVYTSMTMLVAEELNVDISKIKIEFAKPNEAYINKFFGLMGTGGSTSIRDAWETLRKAGASARMMLIAAAADNWGVDANKCFAQNGMVKGPGRKSATYGKLAEKASSMEVPKEVALKPASEWKYIGNTKLKRLDTQMKVTGTAGFGIDTRVPGMLYAAVQMPPMMGGKIANYDDSRAKRMPGVKAIVQYSNGVAVVADSYWNAKKAKDLLVVNYDAGPKKDNLNMTEIWNSLETASKMPGAVFREAGDVDAGMSKASKTIEATYKLPFEAHAAMEALNTFAHVQKDKTVIITPNQFQHIIPAVVSNVVGMKPEQIEVHTTFLGGGFGRKGQIDYVVHAAEISKLSGYPIQLIWSREDDMMHDNYRPAGIFNLKMGLTDSGEMSAFRFHSTSPSIAKALWPDLIKDNIDPFAVEGIDNYPYITPDLKLTYQMHDVGVNPGFWRGVSHNLNTVALECFIDECAKATGQDPIDYRIKQLDMGSTKHQWSGLSAGVPVGSRMAKVLTELKEKSKWGKKLPKGRGKGVAVMEGYNTVVAIVAEVTVSDNYDVSLDKVTAVVDAGTLVHPDQALAQIEGSIIFGQSAGIYGEITVKDGIVQQGNFDEYRVTRQHEAPDEMDIHFMKGDGSFVGGIGEPATAVIVPAIANAVHAACGKRCRTFPLTPDNIAAA